MGGLVQQVNLYRGFETAAAADGGARLLLYAGIAALTVVGLLAIAGEVYLAGLNEDRAAVAASLRRQEAQLAHFRASLSRPGIDPFLEAELTSLQRQRSRLAANLRAIEEHAAATDGGYAEIFRGLARNTVDGLWLNNIGLSAGAAEMVLKGETTEPALVPRLLQRLAAEKAFAGRTFRNVTFERRASSTRAIVDFELRSAHAEEVDDAG